MQVVPGPRYVITGYDGSPNAAHALRRAAAEAKRRNARLDVVRVIPRGGGLLRRPAAWLRLRGDVARLISRSQHLSTRLRIASGDPGTELARLAGHAEVLVIGARVNSQHGTPLGGDTVPTVLSSARCAVIVCDSGGEDGAG